MPKPPIQLKRSGTASATPSSLEHGELALNYADSKVFFKNASNTISSFTFQSYALASHTHAASDITSGTLDAARLPLATTIAAGAVIVGTGLGVSSGTVSVTYGTNSTSACRGDDSRLSDTRTPTDGSVTTAKIDNDAVTYAKLQNVSATDRLLGRSSAGSGDVEEILCTAAGRALLSGADAAAQRTTLSVQPTASPAFTGAATFDNTGNVVPLTVTNTGTANSFVVNDASGDTSPFVIDASGNVGIGTSSPACILDLRVANTGSLGPQVNLWNTGTFNNTNSCRIGFATDAGGSTTTPNAAVDAVQVVGAGGGTELRFLTWNGSSLGTRVTVGHTGQLLVTAGSGSSGSYKPGIAVSGDDDTGLQQVGGAGTISIVTQGSERVRVDASGQVGVGVTPTHRLDCNGEFRLRGTGASTEAGKLHLYWVSSTNRATWTTDASGNALIETGSSSPAERFRVGVNGRSQFFAANEKYGIQLNKSTTANGPFIGSDGADIFTVSASGGGELLRIDASGNVGIGVSPLQRLHVIRSGTGIVGRFTDNSTQTLDVGVTASAGVYLDNPNSGYVDFQIGGVSGMRLTGGSELLIGTTTDNGAYKLQVNSQIYATNATIATSDARFKKNVEALTDATAVIEDLRPVAFDFIPHAERNFATERQVGLIAQEAQSALAGTDYADSVVAQCGDHLGLAYEKLVPVLIKALQESNARIAALEERLNHA